MELNTTVDLIKFNSKQLKSQVYVLPPRNRHRHYKKFPPPCRLSDN